MAYKIKRGVNFIAEVKFTAEKWALTYPWTSVASSIKQGARRIPLTVEVNASEMTIKLSATASITATLAVGVAAEIDLWVDRGGIQIAIPSTINIPLSVIDGATR